MIRSSLEIHIGAVLDLSAVAASLYALGSRAKAEAAHVEAELSYTRLMIRLDGSHTALSQAVLQKLHEALRRPVSCILHTSSPAPS